LGGGGVRVWLRRNGAGSQSPDNRKIESADNLTSAF
jgi:hypothetical protein